MFQLVLEQTGALYIHDAFSDIDEDCNLCCTACQSVFDKCEKCYNVADGHFDHIKDYTVSV